MISSGIVLIAAVLTVSAAVPGFMKEEYSLEDMFSRLSAQNTLIETRMCNGHCLVMIGNEERLLNVGEDFIDPEDPCKQIVCQTDGVTTNIIQCSEVDTCSDGNPPYRLPGQCCYTCGGGPRDTVDTFTDWGEWTECSKTCGGGARARRRECTITEERVLVNCSGETLKVESCNPEPCPVPCLWTYTEFGVCSVTCGEGIRQRFPIITQNASQGGKGCPPYVERGDPEEIPCKEQDCPACPVGKTLCLMVSEPYYNQCIEDDDDDCVPNSKDNCQNISNTDQSDMDDDNVGDICDNCVVLSNPGQENADGDLTGDSCDGDDDNDGINDAADNCQFISNNNQLDSDGDGYGDVCDNCRDISNTNQNDYDRDGAGNVCDNCRYVHNPAQESDARQKYGEDCTKKPSPLSMNEEVFTESDKQGLANEIMEKLLQMYYSN